MPRSVQGNRLLASLPSDSNDRLRPRLSAVAMVERQPFQNPGQPIDHVFFPDFGVVSRLMSRSEGELIEVATVGREGFVGTTLVLETDEASIIVRSQFERPLKS